MNKKHVINPELIEKWPLEKHVGVFSKLLIDGENTTVLWSKWDPNASAPVHTHPHEQCGICFEGEIIFTIDGEDYTVHAGEFYHIPPNVPHAERNEGVVPAVLTDFFAPVRSDLLSRRFQAQTLDETSEPENKEK